MAVHLISDFFIFLLEQKYENYTFFTLFSRYYQYFHTKKYAIGIFLFRKTNVTVLIHDLHVLWEYFCLINLLHINKH